MPEFSLLGAQRYQTWGAVTGSSDGTAVTAGGTANTKTTNWVEIISAANNAIAADGILVMMESETAAVDCLVDIAIGAAGSEVIIAANLYVGTQGGGSGTGAQYYLPVKIPSGTRISAKSQSTTASVVINVLILAFAQGQSPSSPLATVDTYGANTADSGGTSIDPGGTINTKPTTWTQIVASTTRHARQLMVAFPNQANNVRLAALWLVDIAVGASTSEQTLITDMFLAANTTNDLVQPQTLGPFPVDIPAGTRLSARAQCSITDATDRLFDMIIYGVG